jgi:hypothetical protein
MTNALAQIPTAARKTWIRKLLRSIRALERSCLSDDSEPTTLRDLMSRPLTEVRDYYRWLRNQASGTAMGYDDDWQMFVEPFRV